MTLSVSMLLRLSAFVPIYAIVSAVCLCLLCLRARICLGDRRPSVAVVVSPRPPRGVHAQDGDITQAETDMLGGLSKKFTSQLSDRGAKMKWMWMNVAVETEYKAADVLQPPWRFISALEWRRIVKTHRAGSLVSRRRSVRRCAGNFHAWVAAQKCRLSDLVAQPHFARSGMFRIASSLFSADRINLCVCVSGRKTLRCPSGQSRARGAPFDDFRTSPTAPCQHSKHRARVACSPDAQELAEEGARRLPGTRATGAHRSCDSMRLAHARENDA